MSKTRTVYICNECGRESIKRLGHCPSCDKWNSFEEQTVTAPAKGRLSASLSQNKPEQLSQIESAETECFSIPLGEFNRVLGRGIVNGSLILIGGEPGIGKSTLLLQVASHVTNERGSVLYVSGEESSHQIKLRAKRLGVPGESLYMLAETDIEAVMAQLEANQPKLVIIDSIQTMYSPNLETSAGSVTQVREATSQLMRWAKQNSVPVIVTGHVTKEGSIAGPKVLEHIVDVVLYLEGEPFSSYRLLRCVKNRFGSVNEVGIFEMKQNGLVEVENPSGLFLARHDDGVIGSAVVPTIEGNRPLLVEIQALTNMTTFGQPRRTANGLDFGRLLMVAAVLSRRTSVKLGNQDVIISATGGIKVNEPAADLGVALAIASSFKDAQIKSGLAVIGEVGLSGEVRAVSHLDRRLAEVARLGFTKCIVPKSAKKIECPNGLQVIPVSSVSEAIKMGLMSKKVKEEDV